MQTQGQVNSVGSNLYCGTCGYNLRGLPRTDTLRCPECGHTHGLQELLTPATLISRQLRKMETAPASSLGLLLIFCLLTFALVQLFEGPAGSRLPRGDELEKVVVIAVLMMLTAGAMGWTVRAFRQSCSGQRGWVRALVNYYLFAVLMVIGVVGLGASCAAVTRSMTASSNSRIYDVVAVVIQIVLATGIPVWIWWTNRMAKRAMTRLQRSVAVATAARLAEERRKQLAALTEGGPVNTKFRRQT